MAHVPSLARSAVPLALLFTACLGEVQAGSDWILHTDNEYHIQFLSLGTPERRRFDGPNAVKVIWHFGYLDDGTNGGVDATQLKSGNFDDLDVIRDAMKLRAGIEQGGKTTVKRQRPVTLAGQPAIEFQSSSVTSKGATWYSITRMVVVGNALFTMTITAPSEQRLQTEPIQRYLDSFKILSAGKDR